jgi:hypothetical protein
MSSNQKSGNTITVPLNITLSERVHEYTQKNAREGNVVGALQSWVSYYLGQISSGGIMLEAVDHQYLAKLRDGKLFRSSREIVQEVEKAMKREDGLHSYVLQIDPSYLPSIEDCARQQGVTVEQFVGDMFAYIVGSNMIYDFTPANGIMYPASYEQVKAVHEIIGRQPGASDFNMLIKEALDARAAKKKAEAEVA